MNLSVSQVNPALSFNGNNKKIRGQKPSQFEIGSYKLDRFENTKGNSAKTLELKIKLVEKHIEEIKQYLSEITNYREADREMQVLKRYESYLKNFKEALAKLISKKV